MCSTSSKIYFVRHAECSSNITGKILAPDVDILTETGKIQAKLLGKHLKDVAFTQAYSSNYIRAVHTAQIILSESVTSSGLTIHEDCRLRERNVGIFEGGYTKNLVADIAASGKHWTEYVPEGGETTSDVESRAKEFLQEVFTRIDANEDPQLILIVSHASFLLHICWYLTETKSEFAFKSDFPEDFKLLRNTGHFTIGVEKLGEAQLLRELSLLGTPCSKHLQTLDEDALKIFAKEEKVANSFEGCVQQ